MKNKQTAMDILQAELKLLEKKEAKMKITDYTPVGVRKFTIEKAKLSAQKMTIRKMMRKISKL